MNVLIIGGTGILSTAVVDKCIKEGINVTMINRGKRTLFINPNVTLIKCDVHDKEKLKYLIAGKHYDCVIDFLIYNIEQLKYSLEMFSKIANQYVFISSTSVYNTDKGELMSENYEKIQKKWDYSINKYDCEQYLIQFCKVNNVNYTIVRPGVNYGNTRIPYGMYPPIGMHWTLVSRILKEKPIITWNEGQNRHNITRVEDFAQGLVGLLSNPKASCQAFNVVGDYIYTWIEVLETLGKIIGKKVKTVDVPVEFYAKYLNDEEQRDHLIGGRSFSCMTSNAKLKDAVPSFKQYYSLEDGIKLTLNFYKEHNYLGGVDYSYDGLQDRIIDDYYKQRGEKSQNLHYVNYLLSDTKDSIKNKIRYLKGKFYDSNLVKILLYIKH